MCLKVLWLAFPLKTAQEHSQNLLKHAPEPSKNVPKRKKNFQNLPKNSKNLKKINNEVYLGRVVPFPAARMESFWTMW